MKAEIERIEAAHDPATVNSTESRYRGSARSRENYVRENSTSRYEGATYRERSGENGATIGRPTPDIGGAHPATDCSPAAATAVPTEPECQVVFD